MTDLDLKAFESVQVATKKPVVIPGFVIKLKEILAKDLNVLTENDKAILRARVTYLSETQKVTYKDILEVNEEPKKQDSSSTYKELQAQAKALGLKYVGVSKKDLIESLK